MFSHFIRQLIPAIIRCRSTPPSYEAQRAVQTLRLLHASPRSLLLVVVATPCSNRTPFVLISTRSILDLSCRLPGACNRRLSADFTRQSIPLLCHLTVLIRHHSRATLSGIPYPPSDLFCSGRLPCQRGQWPVCNLAIATAVEPSRPTVVAGTALVRHHRQFVET